MYFSIVPVNTHGILAACSGGADSTALLRRLADRDADRNKLAVVHVNYGLRGAESDGDALFVRNLADRLGLRYFEHSGFQENRLKSEEYLRKIRYRFFVRTAEQLGFRYVAVAHTADDQAETVLYRIIRGTGLTGLAGIVPYRQISPAVTLVRPLLHVSRAEILAYLQKIGQDYRTDSSNLSNDFTRNKIRNELLPMLRGSFNPQVDASLIRLARQAAENDTVIEELLDEMPGTNANITIRYGKINVPVNVQRFSSGTRRTIFVHLWRQHHLPMQGMSFEHWQRLSDFADSNESRLELPGGITAER